jgi:hypothetical protein
MELELAGEERRRLVCWVFATQARNPGFQMGFALKRQKTKSLT